MLTMSPTSSSTITPSHNVFARRSSIRRGTVASISKDIRVNDFVEIIKRQKAIQQKERAALIEAENASLLKRRHSMMTMSNKKLPLAPSANNNKTLRSRTRTMSNNDLNASHFNSTNVSQQKQRESKVPSPHTHKQQQMNATDRIRLEAAANNNTLYHHHLRKCSACCPQKEEEDMVPVEYSSSNSDLSTEEEEEEGGCHLSPSTSTSSSSLTSQQRRRHQRPFLNPKNTESTQFLPWQQRNANEVNVIKDIELISNQIKELLDIKSYYSEELQQSDYKHRIQECKALVAQQQKLLDQLGESIETTTTKPPSSPTTPTTTQTAAAATNTTATTNKQKKSTLAICQEVYKSWTLPKSATTQVTIKQKQDKKESDTIISIQGVCTTIESSLIPGKLLSCSNSNDTITSFHPVHQFKYDIDITHGDRLNKFKLLNTKQWQPDQSAHTCSFKHCSQEFNLFQRKHHCRGCGHIFCHTHSTNRLPLFHPNNTQKPVFSRVCDGCFYQLVNVHSLQPL